MWIVVYANEEREVYTTLHSTLERAEAYVLSSIAEYMEWVLERVANDVERDTYRAEFADAAARGDVTAAMRVFGEAVDYECSLEITEETPDTALRGDYTREQGLKAVFANSFEGAEVDEKGNTIDGIFLTAEEYRIVKASHQLGGHMQTRKLIAKLRQEEEDDGEE
jgi:hypothetical protein